MSRGCSVAGHTQLDTQSQFFVSALTGGLAGSALTLLIQSLHRWWRRPILRIVCSSETPGCLVRTPALTPTGGNAEQNYLRLRIENSGRSFAKNTSVCVTSLTFSTSGSGHTTFEAEVFDLRSSLSGDIAVFNLASGGHRFVDLFHVVQVAGQPVGFAFDFALSPIRLAQLGFGPGRYSAQAFVSAENAASTSRVIGWSWGRHLERHLDHRGMSE